MEHYYNNVGATKGDDISMMIGADAAEVPSTPQKRDKKRVRVTSPRKQASPVTTPDQEATSIATASTESAAKTASTMTENSEVFTPSGPGISPKEAAALAVLCPKHLQELLQELLAAGLGFAASSLQLAEWSDKTSPQFCAP